MGASRCAVPFHPRPPSTVYWSERAPPDTGRAGQLETKCPSSFAGLGKGPGGPCGANPAFFPVLEEVVPVISRPPPPVLSHIKDYLVSLYKTIVFLNKNNHFYKKHKKTYTKLKFLIQFFRKLYVSLTKLSIPTKNISKPTQNYKKYKKTYTKLRFSNTIH